MARKKIKNAALIIEDIPSPEDRRRQRLRSNETLLGLYKGVPLSERGSGYGIGITMPDTVTIYRLTIIHAAAGDPARIPKIVADTVWHEFAHHFGMNESEVREREQKRDSHREG